MFIGHYGPAFALKSEDNSIPLWQLFVAVQFVDYLWAGLTLAGYEHFNVVPGFTATNPLDLYYMPFSHSLTATLVWAVLVGVWFQKIHGASMKVALLFGVAVISHWFTDVLVHIPDMPLYGDQHKMGLGIWNFRALAFVIELACVGAGIWWWRHRGAEFKMMPVFALVGVMALFHMVAFFGMEPPTKTEVSIISLTLFTLFTVLAYWLVDRPARKLRAD